MMLMLFTAKFIPSYSLESSHRFGPKPKYLVSTRSTQDKENLSTISRWNTRVWIIDWVSDLGDIGEHISEEEGEPTNEEDDEDDHLGVKNDQNDHLGVKDDKNDHLLVKDGQTIFIELNWIKENLEE